MIVHVPQERMEPGIATPDSYRLSPGSFAISLVLHGLAIGALTFVGGTGPSGGESRRPIYDAYIKPYEKHLVWYPLRGTLPQVQSSSTPYAPKPQGELKSDRTIIANSPNANKSPQLIWQPERPLNVANAVEAPNMIALAQPPAVAPPPPKPKAFVPPPASPRNPAENLATPTLDVPDVRLNASAVDPLQRVSQRSKTGASKQFVAPPPQQRPPRIDTSQPVLAPPPDVAVSGSSSATGSIAALQQSHLAIPPPPGKAGGEPSEGITGGTGGTASGAIVGLNPGDRLRGLPEGNRPGQFSTGPNTGPAGVPSPGGIVVPGLTVEGGRARPGIEGKSAAVKPQGGTVVTYKQTITGMLPSTMSAPLYPSSRTVPRNVEARFHNRTLYVLVIPAPNLPEYTGDWVVWFAERTGSAGSTEIRAPLPAQKIQIAGVDPAAPRIQRRFALPLVIAPDGTVQVIEATDPSATHAIQDLQSWQFRPATRNGAPIEVEAIIDFAYLDAK